MAIISLVSSRCVRSDVGMTGEVTLRGQILPVGGIKEKVLAAHRSGLKTIILPKRNEADLEDIPDEIKETIDFVFVEAMDDVFITALEPAPKVKKKTRVTRKKSPDQDESGKIEETPQ